jgi:hypothetical protein
MILGENLGEMAATYVCVLIFETFTKINTNKRARSHAVRHKTPWQRATVVVQMAISCGSMNTLGRHRTAFFGPEPSHNVSQRQILTIQGPSGCGKSRLALL